jgi:hypothetical protein
MGSFRLNSRTRSHEELGAFVLIPIEHAECRNEIAWRLRQVENEWDRLAETASEILGQSWSGLGGVAETEGRWEAAAREVGKDVILISEQRAQRDSAPEP